MANPLNPQDKSKKLLARHIKDIQYYTDKERGFWITISTLNNRVVLQGFAQFHAGMPPMEEYPRDIRLTVTDTRLLIEALKKAIGD